MSKSDSSFEKYWQTREEVYANALMQGGMDTKTARTIIQGLFEGRKEIYRVVTSAVGQRLDGKPQSKLLDLFSGMATVPWSLRIGGKIKKFTIVDNDEESGIIQHLNQLIAGGLELPPPQFINGPIGVGLNRVELPTTEQVTLINTGLGLPIDDRETEEGQAYSYAEQHGFDAAWKLYPHAMARPHVHNVGNIHQVLRDLSNAVRHVFIADRTKQYVDRIIEVVRQHLESAIERLDGDWRIKEIEQIDDEGTVLAELINS